MQKVIDISEDVNIAILQMGLLRIPNEMIRVVDKAIQHGTPIKTGHWIDDNENEIDAQYGRHIYRCSECNKYANDFVGGIEDWWDLEKPNYCPWCGAKMESEE